MQNLKRLIVVASSVALTGSVGWFAVAAAATYTFNADTNVTLSDQGSGTFTILSGSLADSWSIGTSSLTVTLSSSTGGTFTFSSADRDIIVTKTGGTGTAALTCAAGGVAQVVISQPTNQVTYTLTINASKCTYSGSAGSGSGGGSSGGGGGGGGGGGYYVAPTPTTPPPSPTPSTPQNQLSALLAKLQALQQQLKSSGGSNSSNGNGTLPATPSFKRDLQSGTNGEDVRWLQLFLISKNKGAAAIKLGGVGATGQFGAMTRAALMEFQKNAGITPASGYFGPKTKAYLKSIGQ